MPSKTAFKEMKNILCNVFLLMKLLSRQTNQFSKKKKTQLPHLTNLMKGAQNNKNLSLKSKAVIYETRWLTLSDNMNNMFKAQEKPL